MHRQSSNDGRNLPRSLSFPKLAQRFGNARPRETPSPLPAPELRPRPSSSRARQRNGVVLRRAPGKARPGEQLHSHERTRSAGVFACRIACVPLAPAPLRARATRVSPPRGSRRDALRYGKPEARATGITGHCTGRWRRPRPIWRRDVVVPNHLNDERISRSDPFLLFLKQRAKDPFHGK